VQETYRSAPIIEAVLDIKARLSPDSLSTLAELQADTGGSYPIVRQPFRVNFKLEKANEFAEPTTEASHIRNGYAFVSEDRLQIFQARPDGFSHNRLAPYVDWQTFKEEAKLLWTKYREKARPVAIELLGLNYINKITFPAGAEISHYLRTYVQVPEQLPQMLEAQNLFIQMNDPQSDATVAISVNLIPTTEKDKVSALLNIQCFRLVREDLSKLTEESIWNTFDRLRDLKNLAFESSITEKTRGLIR
jgi:uncharacterized protein (TIGR04255 family)